MGSARRVADAGEGAGASGAGAGGGRRWLFFRPAGARGGKGAPKSAEEELQDLRASLRLNRARAVVGLNAFFSLCLSAAMVYYGARGRGAGSRAEFSDWWMKSATGLNETAVDSVDFVASGDVQAIANPLDDLLWVGVPLMIFSLAGAAGAAFPRARVGAECLFVYFVALLLLFCMLLWSAMMCFFFQGAAARDLEHFVDREWAAFAEVAQLQAREIEVLRAIENRDHLVVGGSVCLVAAILTALGLRAASQISGHVSTMHKLLLSSSVAAALAGVAVTVISLVAMAKGDVVGGEWRAGFVIVCGCTMVGLSGIALAAHRFRSYALQAVHLVLISLAAILCSAVAVLAMCFRGSADAFVHTHWEVVERTLVVYSESEARKVAEENLFRLGSGLVCFVALLVLNAACSLSMCLELYSSRGAPLAPAESAKGGASASPRSPPAFGAAAAVAYGAVPPGGEP